MRLTGAGILKIEQFFLHVHIDLPIESDPLDHAGLLLASKNLHAGLRNTLNNKSIKGKLQTILDLIT